MGNIKYIYDIRTPGQKTNPKVDNPTQTFVPDFSVPFRAPGHLIINMNIKISILPPREAAHDSRLAQEPEEANEADGGEGRRGKQDDFEEDRRTTLFGSLQRGLLAPLVGKKGIRGGGGWAACAGVVFGGVGIHLPEHPRTRNRLWWLRR